MQIVKLRKRLDQFENLFAFCRCRHFRFHGSNPSNKKIS
jgi:hypothetical protein